MLATQTALPSSTISAASPRLTPGAARLHGSPTPAQHITLADSLHRQGARLTNLRGC
jgi:hypothetical protein